MAKRAGALGGLLLLLALLGWVELRKGAPVGPDARVHRWILERRPSALQTPVRVLDRMGKAVAVAACGMAAAALAWLLGDRPLAALAAVNTSGLVLWIEGLKTGIARARPDAAGWLVHASGGGFPSGHAAGTAGLCLVLWVLAGRHFKPGASRAALRVGLALLPFAMAASRLCAGVHYLSDVAGGMLLALAWFSACSLWWGGQRQDA